MDRFGEKLMREFYRLISWLFFGLLIFDAPNSLTWAQERTEVGEVGKAYKTRKNNLKTNKAFHLLLYKPAFLSLPFNGYVIGIEGDPPFVSHIGKFQQSSNAYGSWFTCFLFNAYISGESNCENFDSSGLDKNAEEIAFEPVMGLVDDISETIEAHDKLLTLRNPFTHILVYSTGYNTAQWESLANYKDIYVNLLDARGPRYLCWSWLLKNDACKFNPLFIGISWNSFDPTLLDRSQGWFLDFPKVTYRADEIGKKLAVSLFKKDFGIPIILIGHSLGAKILSRLAYDSSIAAEEVAPIDLLIGLQGAFRMRRYVPDHKFSLYQHNKSDKRKVKTAIYTTSIHDDILGKLNGNFRNKFWILAGETLRYLKNVIDPKSDELYLAIGSDMARKKAEDKYDGVFSFAKVDEEGKIFDMDNCGNGRPVIVNADDLIQRNPFGGISGAHSDIYRREMGTFLWNVIRNCALD